MTFMNPLALSAMGTAVPAVAACAVVGGAAYASVAPRCSLWGAVVHRGDPARAAGGYALTFDDGPTGESTPRVLDTLARLGAKATFFVIGANARRHPEIVRRIHAEGHVVANHTMDHSHYGMMRAQWYWDRQLRETDELLASIIGVKPALFRPPMGVRTWHVTIAARRYGHTIVTWSRRAMDGLPTTAERIVNRLTAPTRAGDILILHDGVEPHMRRDPSASVAAVGPVIETLRARGLEPRSLEELTGVRPYAGLPA
jgi:peptidoglycan/xylan/chitin deacetylase (PgdA/CDA1 family)